MEQISEDDFKAIKVLEPTRKEETQVPDVTPKELEKMIADMENPVKAQKELAVHIQRFLNHRIKIEMESKGVLSDHTRRWAESFNNVLEKIQKAIHGDKSVNLHLHKVSHSQIAEKMRNARGNRLKLTIPKLGEEIDE